MKKSKPIVKIILYGLIAVVIMSIAVNVYREKKVKLYKDYTSYSTREKGTKALYLLSDRMGFETDRYFKSAKYLPNNSTMVLIKPYLYMLNDEEELWYLKVWMQAGNTLILIDDVENIKNIDIKALTDQDSYLPNKVLNNDVFYYKIGKGKLVFLDDSESFTNQGLKDSTAGVRFINELDEASNEKVLFNEYYHDMIVEEDLTLWELIGPVGRIAFIQFCLGVILIMFVKSRRFGKPVTVFAIEKRRENENLYALSNIYMKAGANLHVLKIYTDLLKKDLSKYLGLGDNGDENELAAAVSQNKELKKMGIEDILYKSKIYEKENTISSRKLMQLVGKIDEVRRKIK